MKSFFTEIILKRGKTYFEQNRVFSVNQYDNQTYTGIILGNEAYHTKITLDEHYDVMSATCDCPYAKEGNHCKHEAALYFAIEDRLPKDEQQYIDINALL
ncbi:MAG: SWIM zinc finger family protein [Coprobacillus sp.]|nr:SWIM zinc finger family protein [Coprobacillus sp.]